MARRCHPRSKNWNVKASANPFFLPNAIGLRWRGFLGKRKRVSTSRRETNSHSVAFRFDFELNLSVSPILPALPFVPLHDASRLFHRS